MTDIVMRLLEEWTFETEDVMGKAAVEIERLRADLLRAEAVVEVADEFYTRLLVAHATGEFEMPPRLAPFAEALGEALEAYDKERDDV